MATTNGNKRWGIARTGISLMLGMSMALGSVPALALEDLAAAEAPAQEQIAEVSGVEETTGADELGADLVADDAVAEPVEEVTVDDAAEVETLGTEEPTEESTGSGSASDDAALAGGLSVQAASYRNLPLNGSTTYGYFSCEGQEDFYTFTLAKPARIKLELQNWTTNYVWWGLYNDSMSTCHFSNDCSAKNPGTLSIDSYLDAGTYRLKVHSGWGSTGIGGSGTGDYQIRASKKDVTSPVRNGNATFDTAATLGAGTVGTGLFTFTGADYNYWRINVPTDERIRIICKETESDCDSVRYVSLYNAACSRIDYWSVYPTATVEKELTAGTYYIKLERNYTGPYSIQWAAVTYSLANSEATLAQTSYTYNGKAKRPSAVVRYGGAILQQGTDYTVTYQNNVNAGTATAIITGKGHYTGTVRRTFVIAKAKQPLSVKVSNRTASARTLRKKAATISPLSVSKAKGKVTYAKVSGSKCLTVNKSTGTVKVKKGTKRGTYKIKVKVKAAATANYKARTITRTVKVVVK